MGRPFLLPFPPALGPGSKPRTRQPSQGGWEGAASVCRNCWWAERGSGVGRLEGDSFWEL